MKKLIIFLTALALVLSLSVVSFAHSGRTDGKGGHTNHSTGEYHYHHGYPAHDHINGTCPYDFDDQTGRSSGTSTAGAKNKSHSPKSVTPSTADEKVFNMSFLTAVVVAAISSLFLVVPAGFLCVFLHWTFSIFFLPDYSPMSEETMMRLGKIISFLIMLAIYLFL